MTVLQAICDHSPPPKKYSRAALAMGGIYAFSGALCVGGEVAAFAFKEDDSLAVPIARISLGIGGARILSSCLTNCAILNLGSRGRSIKGSPSSLKRAQKKVESSCEVRFNSFVMRNAPDFFLVGGSILAWRVVASTDPLWGPVAAVGITLLGDTLSGFASCLKLSSKGFVFG